MFESAFVLLMFRAFYLFKRERGRKPQNFSYSLQILLLAFLLLLGGKKIQGGGSKHFTGKYILPSSHPHLEGENKYLLRNGLKTFLLQYCFLGAGVDSHMPEFCCTAEYLFILFFPLFFLNLDG